MRGRLGMLRERVAGGTEAARGESASGSAEEATHCGNKENLRKGDRGGKATSVAKVSDLDSDKLCWAIQIPRDWAAAADGFKADVGKYLRTTAQLCHWRSGKGASVSSVSTTATEKIKRLCCRQHLAAEWKNHFDHGHVFHNLGQEVLAGAASVARLRFHSRFRPRDGRTCTVKGVIVARTMRKNSYGFALPQVGGSGGTWAAAFSLLATNNVIASPTEWSEYDRKSTPLFELRLQAHAMRPQATGTDGPRVGWGKGVSVNRPQGTVGRLSTLPPHSQVSEKSIFFPNCGTVIFKIAARTQETLTLPPTIRPPILAAAPPLRCVCVRAPSTTRRRPQWTSCTVL